MMPDSSPRLRKPLSESEANTAADLMAEATSWFIQPHYALEALDALEAAGWTITPPD